MCKNYCIDHSNMIASIESLLPKNYYQDLFSHYGGYLELSYLSI